MTPLYVRENIDFKLLNHLAEGFEDQRQDLHRDFVLAKFGFIVLLVLLLQAWNLGHQGLEHHFDEDVYRLTELNFAPLIAC